MGRRRSGCDHGRDYGGRVFRVRNDPQAVCKGLQRTLCAHGIRLADPADETFHARFVHILQTERMGEPKPFKKAKEEPTVTEDELYDIMETVAAEGALDEDTTELVQSALQFSDTFVREVLTPWEKVVFLPVNAPHAEILSVIRDNAHSRLPVVDEEGHPIGVLLIRKYLKAHMRGETPELSIIMESVHFVDADMPIDDLFPVMSQNKTHLSIPCATQSGKRLAIITMEDILEELVGEIYDEDDHEEDHAEAAEQGGAA